VAVVVVASTVLVDNGALVALVVVVVELGMAQLILVPQILAVVVVVQV
jgi:hypothetical protein